MFRYTALAPMQIAGREIRSGESFELDQANGDDLVTLGVARREPGEPAAPAGDPQPAGKPAAKRK